MVKPLPITGRLSVPLSREDARSRLQKFFPATLEEGLRLEKLSPAELSREAGEKRDNFITARGLSLAAEDYTIFAQYSVDEQALVSLYKALLSSKIS